MANVYFNFMKYGAADKSLIPRGKKNTVQIGILLVVNQHKLGELLSYFNIPGKKNNFTFYA